MIAAVLLGTACLAPLASRRWTGVLFSPAALAMSVWCGTVGLLKLDLLPYVPITTATWQLLVAAVVALVAGAIVGEWVGRRAAPVPITITVPAAPDRWVLLYAGLGVAGLVWYVYAVVSRFGWIFDNGLRLRALLNALEVPSTYLFLQQFCGTTALLAWGLWLAGVRLRRTTIAAAIVATTGTLLTTDRTQFFALVMTAAFMYLLLHGPGLRPGRLLLLGVGAPLLLVSNFLIIGAWTGRSNSTAGVALRWPGSDPGSLPAKLIDGLQGGTVIYLYATGAYPALSEYLKMRHPPTLGAHVAYPAARFLQRTGLVRMELPPAIPPFVPIATRADGLPLQTNSYTFLYYPLEDFGIPGALAYAALVGLLCGGVHGWVRAARESPARLLVGGQIATALALTTFANKFNNTASWYVLALSIAPFVATCVTATREPPTSAPV